MTTIMELVISLVVALAGVDLIGGTLPGPLVGWVLVGAGTMRIMLAVAFYFRAIGRRAR